MTAESGSALPVSVVRALFELYRLHWHEVGFCDYGDHAGITWDENTLLAEACEAIEPHEAMLRERLEMA